MKSHPTVFDSNLSHSAHPTDPTTPILPIKSHPLFLQLAQPLIAHLAWAESIRKIDQPVQIFQNLVYEMQNFQLQLKAYYPESILKIANYLFCIALDECTIGPLTKDQKNFHQQSLLYYFHRDLQGKKRFFNITEVLLKNKNIPQELAILAYFCLALGYQGHYYSDLKTGLQNTFHDLYHLIQWHPHNRLIHIAQHEPLNPLKEEEKIDRLLMFMCVIILLTFCICYICFTVKLNYYSHDIMKLY